MLGNLFVAGEAARSMLDGRMVTAADLAAENVPYFLVIGQQLITQIAADPRLLSNEPDILLETLRWLYYCNSKSFMITS